MALLAGIWLNLLLLVVATRSIWNFDHRITRKKVIGGSHGKDPRCTPGGPAKFLALPPTVCIRHTPGGGRALTSSRACAMKCQENKKYAVGRIYNPWENFEACTVALEQHDIKC